MKRKIALFVLLAALTVVFSTNAANAHPWRHGWGRVYAPHVRVVVPVPVPVPPRPVVVYRNNYRGGGYCRPHYYGNHRYYSDRGCRHGRGCGYNRYYR